MSGYMRPEVVASELRDDDGNTINFGNRWDDIGGAPTEKYSSLRYSERFAPLEAIGNAVIDYLVSAFDVELIERDVPEFSVGSDRTVENNQAESLHDREIYTLRDVVLAPSDPNCVSLWIVITSLPGLYVGTNEHHEHVFPRCACEACDETWEVQADDFEQTVDAVISGRFIEQFEVHQSRSLLSRVFTRKNRWVRESCRERARRLSLPIVVDPRVVARRTGPFWMIWRSRVHLASRIYLDESRSNWMGQLTRLGDLHDIDKVISRVANHPDGYSPWPRRSETASVD